MELTEQQKQSATYGGATKNILVRGGAEYKAITINNSIGDRDDEYRAKKQ